MSDEITFFEPEDLPQPKEAVRVRRLLARPYPDGRRVRVEVGLTPFRERPNIELEAFNSEGQPVGALTIIESIEHNFELTLHLRGERPGGRHTLRLQVIYPTGPPPVIAEAAFEVTPPDSMP